MSTYTTQGGAAGSTLESKLERRKGRQRSTPSPSSRRARPETPNPSCTHQTPWTKTHRAELLDRVYDAYEQYKEGYDAGMGHCKYNV